MSVEEMMIMGVVGITVITLLFLGPGMWSSSTGYPLIEKPYQWLKAKLGRKGPPEAES